MNVINSEDQQKIFLHTNFRDALAYQFFGVSHFLLRRCFRRRKEMWIQASETKKRIKILGILSQF